jgi:hypothetical protein
MVIVNHFGLRPSLSRAVATFIRAGLVGGLALAGAGCRSSSTSEAAVPFDSGITGCDASWCGDFQTFCDNYSRLCSPEAYGQDPAKATQSCVDAIGFALGQMDASVPADVSARAAKAQGCVVTATTCDAAKACLLGIRDPSTTPPPHSDAGVTDVWSPPADVVTLPGDNPNCVRCAVEQCGTSLAPCFEYSATDPACQVDGGGLDCCVDYRGCLNGCAGLDPSGGGAYATCAADCGAQFPRGQTQFAPYAKCMADHCAGCSSDAG